MSFFYVICQLMKSMWFIETGCNRSSPFHLSVCFCLAPCVLRECGRHPKRQQPDHSVYGRQDVLLESGHALPASGTPATRSGNSPEVFDDKTNK